MKPLTDSARDHFQPACSQDGRYIYFLSGTDLWSFDRRSGEERKLPADPKVPVDAIADCKDAVWSQDKERLACSAGQDVLIRDAVAGKEVGRLHFGERATAPKAIAWSPDRKWLLVGTPGQDDNSTSRQSDYFALDLGRMAWIPVGSGNDAMWLPGRNEIVYSTPRELVDLTPSSKHRVWSTHLMVFDPVTRRRTPLTSGVTNNIQPAPCMSAVTLDRVN